MSSNTPGGFSLPPPTFSNQSLSERLAANAFQYKPGLVVDNAVYGRIRTKECFLDRREEKLDQLQQYWRDNKDYLSGPGANYIQGQMAQLQNSINPNQQYWTSGPTANQQTWNAQQLANAQDVEKMTKDPIYGAARGAGMSKENAEKLSVVVELLHTRNEFKEKPQKMIDTMNQRTRFNVGPE